MAEISESQTTGGVLGATFLVMGTTIGAAMLALPVLTALGGFVPSLLLYLICWLLMAGTGLLFLELVLWMGAGTNIVSMSGRIMGRSGRVFAWIVYLYLFYSLTVSYVAGGGLVIADITDGAVPPWLGSLLLIIFFAPWVYVGPKAVDKTNFIMVIGLAISYLAFIVLGSPHVDIAFLGHADWSQMLFGLTDHCDLIWLSECRAEPHPLFAP